MENVKNLLNELRGRKLNQSKRGAYDVIKQTDARKIKRKFMAALFMDLKELINEDEFVGVDSNGVVLEIANKSVDAFTIELNPKVKNLDFDAYESVELYKQDLQIKAEKKEQRKRDKAAEFKYAKEKRDTIAKRKAAKE
ncbi:MAG: hypothetical protein ACOC1K_00345 [Nanoarchaeota archaeon]